MKNKLFNCLMVGAVAASTLVNPLGTFAQESDRESAQNIDLEDVLEAKGQNTTVEQGQKDFASMVSENVETIDNDIMTVYELDEKESNQFVYLSDLDYLSQSKAGWGNIQKDKNVDGGTISLVIDGEQTFFHKGMGAHATSNLIYDLQDVKDDFTRFSSYVGVDYSKKGKSDGVKFAVYVSEYEDKGWQLAGSTDVIRPEDNAYKFDIDLSQYSYRYLKLTSTVYGSTASDHAVYGNCRLLKASYDESDELYKGLKKVSAYDEELSKRSVKDNIDDHKTTILKRELVNRIGYQNIQSLTRQDPTVKNTLNWLLQDENALSLFIEAGGYFSGSGYNALNALHCLYQEYKDDMGNSGDQLMYKKMLLATAAAYSKNIKTFLVNYGGKAYASDPVVKFKEFKELYDDGSFIRKDEFKTYPMEIIRTVMDSRINDEEIDWLRDYIDIKYPPEKYLNNWVRYNGYGYSKYVNTGYNLPQFYDQANKTKWDDKYGFLKYGISYGESQLYRIWMFMEAGAICWGLSGIGMVVNEVQGIPAVGTYQPGHEAYLLYSVNDKGEGLWNISDNVGGWKSSFSRWGSTTATEHRLLLEWGQKEYNTLNSGNNTTYMLLAQDALNHYDDYVDSMYYYLLSNSYKQGSDKHEEALNGSLQCYSKNLDAMYGLYKSYLQKENMDDKQWLELAHKVVEEYTYFPAPMVDLLKLIKAQIKDSIAQIEVDMIQTEALHKASAATEKESLQSSACREIASSLLGKNAVELATFSFDGDDANTIKINESYDNTIIQVRVSLDGGHNWLEFANGETYTNEHQIKLTKQQVSQITAENDIYVGLMGTDKNYVIDIKAGKTLGSDIYKNDDENLLLGGNTASLEYSLDDGQTWQDYESGINSQTRIEGNVTALFRYKATGVYLRGDEKAYQFTANKNNEKNQYVQLKNVYLKDYSSQQDSTKDRAAINLIDGSMYTAWHTKYNDRTDLRYYVTGFNRVRYVSQISFLPGTGNNGRPKTLEIYTSIDGKDWTLVKTQSLENNAKQKDIVLDEPVAAKYVKLHAKESYGNSTGEANMYFSGRMLWFYEDTTQQYVANPTIEYSTTDPTNGDVTATLILPTGCHSDITEHTFTQNDTYQFVYTDENDEEKSIEAKVTWIDKTAPTGTVTYSTTDPTNGKVVATLTDISEDDVTIISEGGNTHEFSDNGEFTFKLKDRAGNIGTVQAKVTWIDKDAPVFTVKWNTTKPTNQPVIATVEGLQDGDIVIGESSHTFDENGSWTFKVQDQAGNISSQTVTVSWIDKVAPTGTLQYSSQSWTNEEVTVSLTDLSENVTFKDGSQGTHTFKDNGTYTFIIVDEAGNESRYEAKVNWIDNTKVEAEDLVVIDQNGQGAQLNINDEAVEILSVNGEKADNTYKMDKNGTYTFKLRLRETGYEFEYTVVVDSIVERVENDQNENITDSTQDENQTSDDQNNNTSVNITDNASVAVNENNGQLSSDAGENNSTNQQTENTDETVMEDFNDVVTEETQNSDKNSVVTDTSVQEETVKKKTNYLLWIGGALTGTAGLGALLFFLRKYI